MQLLLSLLVVVAGLTGRAVIDKALAVTGGPILVAAWAQLSSIASSVTTVSMAGFGVAVIARIASSPPCTHLAWVRTALEMSLTLSGIVAILGIPLTMYYGGVLIPSGEADIAVLSLVAGWFAVASDLAAFALIGAGRPGQAAMVTAAAYLVQLASLWWLPVGTPIARLLIGQVAFGAGCLWYMRHLAAPTPLEPIARSQLLSFSAAGLAIGLLSPGAAIFSRAMIAAGLSWDATGMVQAIWRSNEWTVAITGGLLNLYFLPRLGRAIATHRFRSELRAAALLVLPSAAIISVCVGLLLPLIVTALYRPEFVPRLLDAAPFLLGDWFRIAAWVPLAGLYALNATRAVTTGELLSQPLFALILFAGSLPQSIPMIGWAWAGAYLAYATYNAMALRERLAFVDPLDPLEVPPQGTN